MMTSTVLKWILFPMLVIGILAGCSGASFLPGGDPDFDGVWRGRLLFTIGEEICPRRANLRAEIINGRMVADVRWSDGTEGRFTGTIRDGSLLAVTINRGSKPFADEGSGQFSEREAEGRYKGPRCSGSWTLQKIRSTVG